MIIRRRHTKNFTTISNVLFDDPHLGADEIGVLAYLLSRPHDWEIRRSALMRRWNIGPGTMKRIVNNWMKAGWCAATKVRLPNGTFCILYDISDLPGKKLSDDEIRMALSLVSSEVDPDGVIRADDPDEPPPIPDDPPPPQPVVVDHPGGDEGVAYIDKPNTELPRTDSDQKAERERARAKEKHALNLVDFKRRWPTASSDDQALIDGAWFDLSFDEGDEALANIARFIEKQKKDGRTKICAGQTYLRQKRWTLLEPADAVTPSSTPHARDSIEARALIVLHDIAGKGAIFHQVYVRDAGVSYGKPVTPQLAALAQAGRKDDWPKLDRRQAGAWEELLRENVLVQARQRLVEGSRAPWPWPPRKDGTLSTAPPAENLMTEDDANHI